MSEKWTKGPWEFRAGNDADGDSCDLLMAEIGVASDDDPEYAEVFFGQELSDAERSANWTLASAAPELFDALEEMLQWTTSGPCQLPMMDPCRCMVCKTRRAHEALGKARGVPDAR